MKIDDLFTESMLPSVKLAETHMFVRMGHPMKPLAERLQIIRVEPMVTDDGMLIPQNVVLTIDDGAPTIMDRMAAEQMLSTPNCVPLENMLQWKHLIRH